MEKSVLNLVDADAGSLRALRLVEMTEDLENDYPSVCHFDWRKSLIFGVEKSFLFPFSACHP